MSNFYGRDLAYIHDSGYAWFARQTAPGVLSLLRQRGPERGLVVEFGCGGGILARDLIEAGYDVIGVDISPAMIEMATARVPQARFVLASAYEFDLPTCSAITALGEVLAYESDQPRSNAALKRFFRRAYQALEPGGLLIFDLPEQGRSARPRPAYVQTDDWACLVKSEEDQKRGRLTRRITSYTRQNNSGLFRRVDEVHRLRLFPATEVVTMLRSVGFRARIVRRLGEFEFGKHWAAFVARKPL